MLFLISLEGSDVLPSSPDQLFFLVPLDHVFPDGNRCRHEDAHDDETDGNAQETMPRRT
jgi:hypothetical protein